MKRLFFIVVLGFLSFVANAQVDSINTNKPDNAKKIKFSVLIEVGGISCFSNPSNYAKTTNYWLNAFRAIAPYGKFINADFSGFNTSKAINNPFNYFNILFSYPIKLKSNTLGLEIKGGLLFNAKQRESLNFKSKDTAAPFIYNFEFRGNNVGFEISPTLYLKKLKIINPYIGVGAGIALSSHNRLICLYNAEGRLYESTGFLNGGTTENKRKLNNTTEVETIRLPQTISYMLFIPFGVELKRISKPTFFSLFIDFRYGLKIEKYPSINYTSRQAISFLVGLKYNFYKRTN